MSAERRNPYSEQYAPFWWQHTRAWQWLVRLLYVLGVASGAVSAGFSHPRGYWAAPTGILTRQHRPYVLGWRTDKWRCLLRYHHWPTRWEIAFGMCGKCLPWPCCAAITVEHADGCDERDAFGRSAVA